MSWHVGLYGGGVLSRKAVDKWLAESIEPKGMIDFAKQSPAWFPADFRTQTVKSFLADVARFNATSGHEYIQLTTAGSSLSVRAVLSEGYVRDWLSRIVAALRAAGRAGFVGDVYLLGLGEPMAAKLSIARKSATWEELEGPAAQMVATRATIEELDALSRARTGQAAAPPPKPPREPRRPARIPMPTAAAGDLAQVASALESRPATEVLAAVQRAGILVNVGRQTRLLHELLDSPAEALAACCGTSAAVASSNASDVFGMSVATLPAFAIRVLAELDPGAAAPLAARLFRDDWPDLSQPGALSVRLAAAHALARVGDEASIDLLVAALSAPGSYCAAEALRRVRDPAVHARVLTDAERRAKKIGKADADELGCTLDLLARVRFTKATPFLTSLWTSSRVARVRFRAGLALVDLDTPDALMPLIGRVSDKDELIAGVSVLALVRTKPKRAFDELHGLFASKKQYALASRVLAVLTGGRTALAPLSALPADPAPPPSLDARWFTLAQDLLDDTDYGPLAVTLLTVHRRGAVALARRLGTSHDELLCHALEYIGDNAAIPVMQKYVAKLGKAAGAARVRKAIERIQRGERPSEPFVQED